MSMDLGLPRKRVKLLEHNSDWVNIYETEQVRLSHTLNISKQRLYHVGSTSVPGLIAKPIIDIMLSLDELPDLTFFKPLATLDYSYRENASTDSRYFFAKGAEELRTHYLHVVESGSPEMNELLVFRDRLRSDDTLKLRYAKLKTKLAKKYAEDRSQYTIGKKEFIESVIG